MPMCSVKNCRNSTPKKAKGNVVRLFVFPRDPEICDKWKKATGKNNLNTKTARMCSIHFEPTCFKDDWRSVAYGSHIIIAKLKEDAVPSLHMFQDPVRCPSSLVASHAINDDFGKSKEDDSLAEVGNGANIPRLHKGLESNILKDQQDKLREQENIIKKQEERIQALRDAIEACEARCRRHEGKEQQLKKSLAKFFTPGQIKLLANPTHSHIKWSREDISSAMELRCVSPEAYNFLRRKRKFPLPGVSTLRRWAGVINSSDSLDVDGDNASDVDEKELSHAEYNIASGFKRFCVHQRGAISLQETVMEVVGDNDVRTCDNSCQRYS